MATEVAELITGKLGYPTVRIQMDKPQLLHSLYNPVTEAKKIVDSWDIPDTSTIFIVGLGLGYHVLECLTRFSLKHIFVIECRPEVVKYAIQVFPELSNHEQIRIFEPKTEQEFRELFQQCEMAYTYLHMPSVNSLPYQDLRSILQEMHVLKTTTNAALSALDSNWLANCRAFNRKTVLSNEKDKWLNCPGVVVAAGPSLENVLPHLKTLQAHGAILLSATHVMGLLLKENIKPTAYVATEANQILVNHFHSVDQSTALPPLLSLSTVHPSIGQSYKGPVKWVLQRGVDYIEDYATRHGYDQFPTGGSVATLILVLLHYFGCNPIIFVGQDLAFIGGKSHAGESIHDNSRMSEKFSDYVASVHGSILRTNVSWNTFRHWIEHFIETHPDRMYLNASLGAHIQGTKAMGIDEVLSQLNQMKYETGEANGQDVHRRGNEGDL